MDTTKGAKPPAVGTDAAYEEFAREFIRRHPGRSWPVERILVGTDFSLCSLHALERAAALARRFDAELLLLHAEGGPDRMHGPAEAELGRTVERLRDAGVRACGLLCLGPADTELVEAAAREGASLVVVGTHGRSGVQRLVLGSVAERVVRNAPCPVLTVGEGAR